MESNEGNRAALGVGLRGMEQESRRVWLVEFFARERQQMIQSIQGKMRELDRMEIEDAVGDLMLSMFEKADLLPQIENLAGYVYRALHHRVVDWLRRRNRQRSLEETASSGDDRALGELLPDTAHDPVAGAEESEFRVRLLAALKALKPDQRAVWVATEIEGYTFRELSERWGEPIGTLLARKHRAAAMLRTSLQDFYHEL